MMEAIPPNFYACIAGKEGVSLLIGVVLLSMTTLLNPGAAVAGRIAMLVSSSANICAGGKDAARAKAATVLTAMLEDVACAVADLHKLGAKLVMARAKGLPDNEHSRMLLQAARASIRREKQCRLCGSTGHGTPRGRAGTVEYE